jgi:excisionase family DNA binding protein
MTITVAPDVRPLWTVKALAAYLRVSPRQVYNLVNAGAFPLHRIEGVGSRVYPEDVDRWQEGWGA